MTKTLFEAVEAVCHHTAEEDGGGTEFNEGLADIQGILGQTDGGVAGIFFDDSIIKKWNSYNKSGRRGIISQYISTELSYVHL